MGNPHEILDRAWLYFGDCVQKLKEIPSSSIDAVITDPPYPEIGRSYGKLKESEWHSMMDQVMPEIRRVLKPSGSAMFIVQPNMEEVGKMRLWVWEFTMKWGREWNLVQDVYWWNISALPAGGCGRKFGLLRPSVKPCIWLGPSNCYRDQDAVLWQESDGMKAERSAKRASHRLRPGGNSVCKEAFVKAIDERGGVTPFNLIPIPNSVSTNAVNGASTPYHLAEWWVKYICPEGGTVLDPFMGVGTIGRACLDFKRKYVGIECFEEFYATAITELESCVRSDPSAEIKK
jgi:DNA modification methylase